MGYGEYRLKRALDIALILLGLVVVLPMFAMALALVWMDSKDGVLFCQKRWGKNMKRIRIFKLKTVRRGSSQTISPIGRLLRATGLDEMPQLYNIFKGEMSFVGPRPLAVDEVPEGTRELHMRCMVKPGLTGLAQLACNRKAPVTYKLEYDALYMKQQNLWLDIKLFCRSLLVTVTLGWDSG